MFFTFKVQPFAGIIDTVRWTVPRLLFNRNSVGPFKHGKRAKDFMSEGTQSFENSNKKYQYSVFL